MYIYFRRPRSDNEERSDDQREKKEGDEEGQEEGRRPPRRRFRRYRRRVNIMKLDFCMQKNGLHSLALFEYHFYNVINVFLASSTEW